MTLDINTRDIELHDFLDCIYANMNIGGERPTLGWKLSNARKTDDDNHLETDEDVQGAFGEITALNNSS